MSSDPLYHTIISTDVEKSSSRTDDLLLRMRRDLRQILVDTLVRQHVDVQRVAILDDGDGFRVLLPPGYSPHTALDPFITRLLLELRTHREASSSANRLRLRVAIHSGLLFQEDGGGYTGTPLKDCARLLDAEAGRTLLAENPTADLVVLVSNPYYDDVVRGGRSLDPAAFRPIRVKVKETNLPAWAYLPSGSGTSGSDTSRESVPSSSGTAIESASPPATSSVNIRGDGHTFHGPVFGGHQYG